MNSFIKLRSQRAMSIDDERPATTSTSFVMVIRDDVTALHGNQLTSDTYSTARHSSRQSQSVASSRSAASV